MVESFPRGFPTWTVAEIIDLPVRLMHNYKELAQSTVCCSEANKLSNDFEIDLFSFKTWSSNYHNKPTILKKWSIKWEQNSTRVKINLKTDTPFFHAKPCGTSLVNYRICLGPILRYPRIGLLSVRIPSTSRSKHRQNQKMPRFHMALIMPTPKVLYRVPQHFWHIIKVDSKMM